MAFALECQNEIKHDMLNDDVVENENRWCQLWCHMFEYPALKVQSNLRTNKPMRQGFVDILLYIANPYKPNLFQTQTTFSSFWVMRENERPLCIRNSLQRGGSDHAVLQACFDIAMDQDLYLGDGEHHQSFQKISMRCHGVGTMGSLCLLAACSRNSRVC